MYKVLSSEKAVLYLYYGYFRENCDDLAVEFLDLMLSYWSILLDIPMYE